jgi:Predicted membrane protein (DUF2238)
VGAIFRDHPRLSAAFGLYYLGLIGLGALSGQAQTVFYAVFVGAAAIAVASIYERARFSGLVLWGLAAWGLGHMVGGLVEIRGDVLYEVSLGAGELRFDKLVHFVGFGFGTLAAFEMLRARIAPDAPTRFIAIAAWFVGVGLGGLNETVEFVITRLPFESHVGGFSNTGWDLVANALGATVAAVVAARWLQVDGAGLSTPDELGKARPAEGNSPST